MSSSGTPTSNYKLNQWAATDKPERADFNEDNKKVDAALYSIAQSAASITSGATKVGNADKLDGYDSADFMLKTGAKTFYYTINSAAGWYRIFTHNNTRNILIRIKETANAEGETLMWAGTKYASSNSPTLTVLGRNNYNSSKIVTARYVSGLTTDGYGFDLYLSAAHTAGYNHQIVVEIFGTPSDTVNFVDSLRIVSETGTERCSVRMDLGGILSSRYLVTTQGVMPSKDNTADIGAPSYRFKQIYAANSTISASDARLKENVNVIDEKYLDFLMALNPVTYKFKDDENNEYYRTHCGLEAQGVEQALYDNGLNTLDFAGLIISPVTKEVETGEFTEETLTDEDGIVQPIRIPITKTIIADYRYGLRYEEFIAPMLKMIQVQQKEIQDLKECIAELNQG